MGSKEEEIDELTFQEWPKKRTKIVKECRRYLQGKPMDRNNSAAKVSGIEHNTRARLFPFMVKNVAFVLKPFNYKWNDRRVVVIEIRCNCVILPCMTPNRFTTDYQLYVAFFAMDGRPSAAQYMLEELIMRISRVSKQSIFLRPIDLDRQDIHLISTKNKTVEYQKQGVPDKFQQKHEYKRISKARKLFSRLSGKKVEGLPPSTGRRSRNSRKSNNRNISNAFDETEEELRPRFIYGSKKNDEMVQRHLEENESNEKIMRRYHKNRKLAVFAEAFGDRKIPVKSAVKNTDQKNEEKGEKAVVEETAAPKDSISQEKDVKKKSSDTTSKTPTAKKTEANIVEKKSQPKLKKADKTAEKPETKSTNKKATEHKTKIMKEENKVKREKSQERKRRVYGRENVANENEKSVKISEVVEIAAHVTDVSQTKIWPPPTTTVDSLPDQKEKSDRRPEKKVVVKSNSKSSKSKSSKHPSKPSGDCESMTPLLFKANDFGHLTPTGYVSDTTKGFSLRDEYPDSKLLEEMFCPSTIQHDDTRKKSDRIKSPSSKTIPFGSSLLTRTFSRFGKSRDSSISSSDRGFTKEHTTWTETDYRKSNIKHDIPLSIYPKNDVPITEITDTSAAFHDRLRQLDSELTQNFYNSTENTDLRKHLKTPRHHHNHENVRANITNDFTNPNISLAAQTAKNWQLSQISDAYSSVTGSSEFLNRGTTGSSSDKAKFHEHIPKFSPPELKLVDIKPYQHFLDSSVGSTSSDLLRNRLSSAESYAAEVRDRLAYSSNRSSSSNIHQLVETSDAQSSTTYHNRNMVASSGSKNSKTYQSASGHHRGSVFSKSNTEDSFSKYVYDAVRKDTTTVSGTTIDVLRTESQSHNKWSTSSNYDTQSKRTRTSSSLSCSKCKEILRKAKITGNTKIIKEVCSRVTCDHRISAKPNVSFDISSYSESTDLLKSQNNCSSVTSNISNFPSLHDEKLETKIKNILEQLKLKESL